MLHMAAIDLEITDLDALEEACKHLGLELVRGQKTWRWHGRWVNDFHVQEAAYNNGIKPEEYGQCADHVLAIAGNKDAYEIGVVSRRDGKPGWVLVYDFLGPGEAISKLIQGENENGQVDRAGKLKQYYVVCKSTQQLKAKGFDYRIITTSNGHVQCVARRLRGVR
jgi:hypothetical protein